MTEDSHRRTVESAKAWNAAIDAGLTARQRMESERLAAEKAESRRAQAADSRAQSICFWTVATVALLVCTLAILGAMHALWHEVMS